MSDQKYLLLLIPMITAMIFIIEYSFQLSSYAHAERPSQSTSAICDGNSCYTTFCSDDKPCQTFSLDQPDEEVSVMQPDEEVSVMQPLEVTEKYVDATLEDCDDGLDNDLDGNVDVTDEECNATTTYSSPVPGQKTSQLDNYEFGRSAQDDGQKETSDHDGGDNKDNYNEQDDSEDNN
jgi:hypothetical protein